MSDSEAGLREEAERRAQAQMSLRIHAAIFVLVNSGLLALDYLLDGAFNWAWWPMLGWGIGLGAHVIGVTYTLSDAHERAVEREMERLRRRQRKG